MIKNQKKKSKKPNKKKYDTIIVGAGISGLYTAYQIIKKHPKHKILIIEGSDRYGGRLNTINYKGTTYEAGGARFNNKHKRVIELIKNFKLSTNKVPIPSDIYFKPHPKHKFDKYNYIDKFVNKNGIIDINPLIQELVELKKTGKISYQELINHSLIDIIDKKLGHKYQDIAYVFEQIFEYWSEIAILNAHESIQLFKNDFNTQIQFYILNGGLSQLINNFVDYLKKHNVEFKKNCYLDNIHKYIDTKDKYNVGNSGNKVVSIYVLDVLKNYTEKQQLLCNHIILAIQQKDLLKIDFLSRHQNISKLLKSISPQPLYRIYARYPIEKGKVWFQNIPKICTNLHIKFIIPYNVQKGLIMISYTDGKEAKYWNDKLADGENVLMKKINSELSKLFPDINIPEPLWVKHHYWSSGAAYWKTGVESHLVIPKIITPFGQQESVYICGENFSNHQAWMEGALQTSELVFDAFSKNIKTINKSIDNLSSNSKIKKSMSRRKTLKVEKKRKHLTKQLVKQTTKYNLKVVKKAKKELIGGKRQTKKDKKYTMEEVSKHNKKSDAWLVINKKVYDVTKWIPKHPGGSMIMKGVGKDATELFKTIGHSSNAKKILKTLKIGSLH